MFAEELIAMRNQRGWTQEETAAKMLVSTSTIANIESGYRAPTPAQAIKADEVFGTPGTFQRHERRMRGIPFSVGFRPFQPHEAAARLIKTFQHSLSAWAVPDQALRAGDPQRLTRRQLQRLRRNG